MLIALMFGLVFALAGTSSALSDDDMASDVMQAVLSDQGVDLSDETVHDRLEAQVVEAIRAGALLWETLNELGFGWESSESQESATTPEASFPGEILRERLRERIREQLRIWLARGRRSGLLVRSTAPTAVRACAAVRGDLRESISGDADERWVRRRTG
jgi:hypothetical protein